MPVGINFDKRKAERFIDALANGKPISPTGAAWTGDDMLALAGACYFGAMTHGPARLSDRDESEIHPERREAGERTFLNDLLLAVEFYSQMTQSVRDGKYDEHFGPEVRAIVFASENGPTVTPVSGFRSR